MNTFSTYLSLVTYLTIFSMKARYRKTIAGFLWVILNPIIMYTAQAYVFKYVLKIDVPNYFLFLLSGLLPWMFITQSLDICVPIIVSNGELIKSLHINPSILILSQLLDNFINFAITFLILFISMIIWKDISFSNFILLPISLLLLVATTSVSVYFLSILHVFYRDTKFILQFLTSVMIFLTPIFYPLSRIPVQIRPFVQLNPFYIIIHHFQILFYSFDHYQYILALLINAIFLVGLIITTYYFTKRRYNEIFLHL